MCFLSAGILFLNIYFKLNLILSEIPFNITKYAIKYANVISTGYNFQNILLFIFLLNKKWMIFLGIYIKLFNV